MELTSASPDWAVVHILLAVLAAFAVTAALTRWLARHPLPWLMDRPNARSLHRRPVPRSGGLALVGGVVPALVGLFAAGAPETGGGPLLWVALAALPVAAVSFADDFGHLSRRLRLAAHGAAALVLVSGGLVWATLDLPGTGVALPEVLAWLLTLLYAVWMVNLYNFMDGMDGFAAGMAVFGFGALAVLGTLGGEPAFAVTAAAIAAAAGGFLTGNFPPARIFLGDLGSSLLGLLAAGLSLWGAGLGLFPLWVGWLAFSPFIADATWTLTRRALAGERVWEAHRSHHYQRLVLAGWGHRKTVLRAYLVMAGAAASAVAAPGLSVRDQWVLIALWVGIYGLIHLRVGLAERTAEAGQP